MRRFPRVDTRCLSQVVHWQQVDCSKRSAHQRPRDHRRLLTTTMSSSTRQRLGLERADWPAVRSVRS